MRQLHDCEDFAGPRSLPRGWEEDVFMHCSFSGLDVEGPGFGGALIGCRIEDSSFYASLFNCATLVNVVFRNCRFAGSSFAGCVLTDCSFIDCRFDPGNMGGECRFIEARWHGCEQTDCAGLPDQFAVPVRAPRGRAV